MSRLKDKIEQCRQLITELRQITPKTFGEYSDIKTRAACEHYAERIVEAVAVIAIAIVRTRKLGIPQDEADAYAILVEGNVISRGLSQKLSKAKGMRNIIVHDYVKVDDELVYRAIKKELPKDAEEFLKAAKKVL